VTTVDGFDVHHHFGPVPGWDQGPGAPELERDLDVRLAAMDRFGIAQACLMPSHSYARPRGTDDLRALNDAVARLRKGAPGRFPVALGTTDLWLGADTVDEARRVLDDLLAAADFTITREDHFCMRGPKTMGTMYEGVAAKT